MASCSYANANNVACPAIEANLKTDTEVNNLKPNRIRSNLLLAEVLL